MKFQMRPRITPSTFDTSVLALLLAMACVLPSSFGFSIRRTQIPEEAIQYQLNALKEANVKEAFAYNSVSNQLVTGPWQTFAACLADAPFRPILGHSEATVLMTISHDEGDYVCCLVKIVPSKDPLPHNLLEVIETQSKELEGFEEDGDEDEEEDAEGEAKMSDMRRQRRPSLLYWWEVSKQLDEEDDEDDYYYLVDSLLPDAEDLELDLMETTMFAIGDELDDDVEDDDDLSGFFFDL